MYLVLKMEERVLNHVDGNIKIQQSCRAKKPNAECTVCLQLVSLVFAYG